MAGRVGDVVRRRRGWDTPLAARATPATELAQATSGGRAILGAVRTGPLSDHTPSPAGHSRRAPTLAAFVTLGLFWGAWAAVLPSVQDATGASKGALGLALLFVIAGAIPSMLLIGGPLVERYGAPAVAVICAVFAAVSTLPGFAARCRS